MVMTKSPALDKTQARQALHGFLELFQTLCNTTDSLKPSELEKYLTQNTELSSNGKIVCHNVKEYLSRIEKYRKKYSHIEIKILMKEPLIAEHNAIINYSARMTGRAGENVELNIMAIAKINDEGKISNWTQVVHEKGTSHWDS